MPPNQSYTQHVPSPDRPMVDLTAYITDISTLIFAQGGMSDVFRGTLHRSLPDSTASAPEQVVVKFLRGVPNNEQDREAIRRRINRESYVWGKLQHINVLPFYGVCRRDTGYNIYGLVAPHCPGNIITYLERQPSADRLGLVLGIAQGLSYLHSREVVHGDVKPRNVLVTERGVPVISDFGTSRVVGYKGFTTTATGCSCRYAPPEVLLWEPEPRDLNNPTAEVSPTVLAPSCDVYSFGMSMLEIVSGKEPYCHRRNEPKIILDITGGVRPQPQQHPDMPDVLWHVAERCWSKEPRRRPDMDSVFRHLQEIHDQSRHPAPASRSRR
ncbi:kinase-like protein [Heliocybe sulcata]|uniref:Kinase-like protein n=1 Tax=Heliocybe sulcata TaxID=5364 RepID=A0A5C3N4Z8_9AGAM|nr:kinase-like protein [Heliocybe sulcata]